MSSPCRYARSFASFLIAASLSVVSIMPFRAATSPAPKSSETAGWIVGAGGILGGICVTIAARDAELALALARQGSFTVHCLAREDASCDALRPAIRACGMYGTVSTGTFDGKNLPYTDNLVNLIVVEDWPALAKGGLTTGELLRVRAPLGMAFVGAAASGEADWIDKLAGALKADGAEVISVIKKGDGSWIQLRKPWPAGIDEWTHYLHGADGNPVAADRVVGPPKHLQWIADPPWLRCHETDSSISTLVSAQGRLFYNEDQAPISLVGQYSPPDKWFLVARDAFNGMALWKVPIRDWGWRQWKNTWYDARSGDMPLNIQKRLVAAGDRVYATLGFRAPVSELDARTGKILQTYSGTECVGEILYLGGRLILSLLEGDGLRIVCVDAASGKRLWVTEKTYRGSTADFIRFKMPEGVEAYDKLDPAVNMAADAGAVALIDGPDIVALNARTGAQKWRTAFPWDKADRKPLGFSTGGNLWIGTMIVRDGVALHASPNQLAALSADRGEVLWTQRTNGHMGFDWKDVFVIDGLAWTWSAKEVKPQDKSGAGEFKIWNMDWNQFLIQPKVPTAPWPETANGYDLRTGELKKSVPLGGIFGANHHHRCYRNKATVNYILASRRGTEFVDLQNGMHTVDNWVRGTCHIGMMPANGLQYAPPHPCVCYIEEKLNGFIALAAARPADAQGGNTGKASQAAVRGPAYGEAPGPEAGAADWLAFRHDALRSGATASSAPEAGAAPLWRVQAGRKVSPPIVVGERLFASLVDEHRVVCLNARDGRKLWEFTAGGRIDSPPAYWRGTVLFGSRDGRVYFLRAEDGALAWRFQAAPRELLIGACGQLESAWPVCGSVLVQNGLVYFAAGRSSHLDGGMMLYALDPATGRVVHQARFDGPHYNVKNLEYNVLPPEGMLPDIMSGDGNTIFMRTKVFDSALKLKLDKPQLEVPGGFLKGTYFKRIPWVYGEKTVYGSMLVHDSKTVYAIRMFDSLRALDSTNFFNPGREGYTLFARPIDKIQPAWSQKIPIRVQAMAAAPGALIAAGAPDVVDPQDPWGAFEGRKGGVLNVFDPETGGKQLEARLDSPPVFNGMAIAGERLYVSTVDGAIACYGTRLGDIAMNTQPGDRGIS